VPNM